MPAGLCIRDDAEPSHVRCPGHSEPNLRVIAALGTVGSTGSVVKITLARSEESRAAVLSAYKLKVLASGFFGAVLTTLLGFY
jgi:two-component system heavy metal sensor histidine kinase CusS